MAKRKGIFEQVARRPSRRPSKILPKKSDGVPGPSDNPATNLIFADVAMRAGGYLAKRSLQKGLLAGRYGKETATEILKNKTLGQSAFSFLLARFATRSVPGAILVGGGALAKTLLDRRKSRHRSKAEGDRLLIDQAKDK